MYVEPVVPVLALDAADPVEWPAVPSLHPRPGCPEHLSHPIISVRQVEVVTGHRIMAAPKAKLRQPQLQPIHLSPAHCGVLGPDDLILVPPVFSGVVPAQPWPQRPALFN